jgi:AcrR family transcriptional regulator
MSEQQKTWGLRERQQQQRKDDILDAAVGLMNDRGFAAMTMEELAEKAGISKPTLYQHFPSKEEIAVQAVVRSTRRARDFIEALDKSLPGIIRLEQALRRIYREKYVHRRVGLGAARDALIPILRAHPEYRAAYKQLASDLIAMFTAGQDEGDIRRDLTPRIAVQMAFSLLRDVDYCEFIESQEYRPEVVVETLLTVLLNGWKAKDTVK